MNELAYDEVCLVVGGGPGLVGPARDDIAELKERLAEESREWLEQKRAQRQALAAT